jgi:hypothetical protein
MTVFLTNRNICDTIGLRIRSLSISLSSHTSSFGTCLLLCVSRNAAEYPLARCDEEPGNPSCSADIPEIARAPLTDHPERNRSMSIKRNKKQTVAIRQGATRPTQAATLVKAPPRPVLVAAPILSPQAHGHRQHSAVHQDAPSTIMIAKAPLQSVSVTAPVLSPKTARRDAHGRFLTKKPMEEIQALRTMGR